MGYGDELMVAGEAKRRSGARVVRYAVRDPRAGRPLLRWNEVWEGNPRFAHPGESFDEYLDIHPGARPYINDKTARQWQWKPYVPEPAEWYMQAGREKTLAAMLAGRVLIAPHVKPSASPNKQWGFARWQALVDGYPHIPWAQIGALPVLKRVPFFATHTFREAVGALAGARAAVLHEGGLHHAAAAVGTPAVVLFGGFISPACTGYNAHVNIFIDDPAHPLGCGMRIGCYHCERAMAAITPQRVIKELDRLLCAMT